MNRSSQFDSGAIDGMLDVILSLALIFILMSALISSDTGRSQEVTLPDMDLSKVENIASGQDDVKKTVISLKATADIPHIYINESEVSLNELETELAKLGRVGQVGLRRDKGLRCEWEDKIIAACEKAGISRVGIILNGE